MLFEVDPIPVHVPVLGGLALLLLLAASAAGYIASLRRRLADMRAELENTGELIENLSEGIYRSSPDGRQLSANRALVELNGYDSEVEMLRAVRDIGREWYVEPGRRDEFRALLRRHGRVTDFVSEVYRHKTRERIWIAESARVVRHKKTGRPLYYEGSVREITETLQRLRLEEQFQKLMSELPGALFQFAVGPDRTRSVQYLSPRFEAITGIAPAELKAQPDLFRERVLDEDRPALDESIATSIRTLSPWESEFRLRAAGAVRWIRITATPERNGDMVVFHGYLADISRRKQSEIAIERLAFFDPLTTLPNRRMFMDRIGRAIDDCARSTRHGALLFIDLDNFKLLNDTHGHDIGDRYLTLVANRLKACLGDGGMVARIGGDEFVVLIDALPGGRSPAVRKSIMIANRVLGNLRTAFDIGEIVHRSSASIGVVVFDGSEACADEILKKADTAMYRAKSAGRNGVALFTDEAPAVAPDTGEAVPSRPPPLPEEQIVSPAAAAR